VRRWLLIAFFLAIGAAAQTPARRTFEVATIKRNPDCQRGQRLPSPGRLDFNCVSVRELLVLAYSALRGDVVNIGTFRVLGGPSWIDNERYDLSAKADGRPPVLQMVGPMLIALLEDRLQLKAHSEPRDTPVFTLTLAEVPRKLQPAPEGSCKPLDLENLATRDTTARYCGFGPSRIEAGTVIADWYGITMGELASRVLTIQVGRLVVDRTGLTGRFDIHLGFRHSETVRVNGVEVPTGEPESAAPTIFAALQQHLGLKLTPATAPIDVVVIDRIERPSEN
jgi:uncharacterized protein (TIGR03435 family)